jgi:hypothetical protein
MILLLVLLLLLAGASFWAGFRAPPHPLQYLSVTGFMVILGLAGITAYFAQRELHTIEELEALITPVPEITDVTYVPTVRETAAIALLSGQPAERDQEYWIVETRLGPDSVRGHYRRAGPRDGWRVQEDLPNWLVLSRGEAQLSVFMTELRRGPGTKVLHMLRPVIDE